MADGEKRKSSKQGTTVHLANIKNPKKVAARLKLSFQRSQATIRNLRTGSEQAAPMVLIDISETGVGFFSQKNLPPGSVVELNIISPLPLIAKGVVVWCTVTPSMMDSTVTRHPFRCGLQFMFENEAERAKINEYCQKVREKRVGIAVSPASAVAPEGVPGASPTPAVTPVASATPSPAPTTPVDAIAEATPATTPSATETPGEPEKKAA